MTAYRRLFEHGFRRLDAEKAHHLGFRAIRAARAALRSRGSDCQGTAGARRWD